MNKISDKIFVLFSLLIYAAIAIVLSYHHALWRDEVQPLNVISSSSNLFDVYKHMHNFGHPNLLVTVLSLIYAVWPHYYILKIVNILVCIGGVYIFLAYSPFSRLQKLLFVFGFFPLYYYPVFSRDYSYIMLLLFAFAAIYPKRFEQIIPLGIILFLLANAHAYAMIMTIAITGTLALEYLFLPQAKSALKLNWNAVLIGFALMGAGIFFAIIQTIPDHTSVIYQPHPIKIKGLIKAFVFGILKPDEMYPTVFGVSSALFTTIIVFLTYLYLWPRRFVFLMFFFSMTGLGLFYHLIFESTEIRYQGCFYLLWVTVLWIEQGIVQDHTDDFRKNLVKYKDAFLALILIIQVCQAYHPIQQELSKDYSSSKSFGKLIHEHPEFKGDIVVGEPDFNLEAISYYMDNPVYFLRLDRFTKYGLLTTENKWTISLDDLLKTCRKLRDQSGKPVLIILGYKLSAEGPYKIVQTEHRNQAFTYSRESFEDFNAHTQLVGSFQKAICDENYDVYLLSF